jgi:hypothetical protein
VLDALGLDGRRRSFARQIDRIEPPLPMRLAIPVEIFLLERGVDVDSHEFGAETRIKRWRRDER